MVGEIIEKALSQNSLSLPDGIYNGRIGQSLLRLFASTTMKIDQTLLCESATYLLEGSEKTYPYNDGLLQGDLGFIWAIGFLVRSGIVQKPSGMIGHWLEILSKNNRYFVTSPIRFNPALRLYPFGIAMMSVHDQNSTTTERYIWEENIILRLNDCKRILTEKIPHIYTPAQLTSAHLHSIYRFAQLAYEASVFPFRSKQILEIIQKSISGKSIGNDIDDYILCRLISENEAEYSLTGKSFNDALNILSYIGTISLIYDIPDLFGKSWEQFISLFKFETSSLTDNRTIGLAMGVVSMNLTRY